MKSEADNFVAYQIDGKQYTFAIDGNPPFQTGTDVVLSSAQTDITYGQSWYDEGYGVSKFLTDEEFTHLQNGLTECVKNIIRKELQRDVDSDFILEKYHKYVSSDTDHFKVVSKTRDLFPADFNFDINQMIPKFEKILGFGLTDKGDMDGGKVHIIVRINRPHSTDFNPPHKDTYEVYDEKNFISKFMNFWIPICGVTENSSLPICPGSHLIPESKIERTIDGGVIAGNKYRVRLIRSWDGKNALVRAKVGYGQLLMFSSQMIHGLAFNGESDMTRVALEFRLFKK